MKRHQIPFLRALSDRTAPMTAAQIGNIVFSPGTFDARSRSASVAGNLWQLIRSGYAERTLLKRELYGYSITDEGRKALAEPEEK